MSEPYDYRRSWFRRIFDEIERDFEMFDEMFDEMIREAERRGWSTPVFHGFSITIGPDGKPVVREFGNVRPSKGKKVVASDVREPLVDVIYDDQNGEVKVIAEMPGVDKDKIHVEATEDSVYLRAEGEDRKYETTVPLEVRVDPGSAKANYKNGVLEIRLKAKEKARKGGVRINVE
ncbi:MAG: archaeal heat shock protein Hsp20 [Conexivisphaera sp.]